MNDVTRILTAIEQGDGQAAGQLLPLVYDELRKLAAARMAAENPGHTLTPPPWSTRRTCVSSATSTSTTAATSSPPRRKQCGAFWSTMLGIGSG